MVTLPVGGACPPTAPNLASLIFRAFADGGRDLSSTGVAIPKRDSLSSLRLMVMVSG